MSKKEILNFRRGKKFFFTYETAFLYSVARSRPLLDGGEALH